MNSVVVALAIVVASTAAGGWSAPGADLGKVEGGHFALDKKHARIVFSTTHLGFSTYYAFFNDFDARLDFNPSDPTKASLKVTINLDGIVASDAKLEKNLKSEAFFDTTRFPKATITSSAIKLTGDAAGKMTGALSLHGVTKPITLDVTFNGGGIDPLTHEYVLGFDAKGSLKRSDFGIKNFVPLVGDQVSFLISCEFGRVEAPRGK